MTTNTRTLLSLQAKLWRRALTRNPQMIIGSVLAFGFILAQCIGLAVYSATVYTTEHSMNMFVFTMALGSIIYLMVSLMSNSSESQIEAHHLATLPLTARDILPGLMLSKFLQTGSIMSVINTIIMAVAGTLVLPHTTALLWIIACLCQLCITLFLGEALSLTISRIGGSQFNERLGLISTIGLSALLLGGLVVLNATAKVDMSAVVAISTRWLGWSPFGAAAHAAAGHPLAWAIAAITLAGSLWLWHAALRQAMRRPINPTSRTVSRSEGKSILLPWARRGVFGALYSRTLRYWFRDSRQITNLAMFPMLAATYLAIDAIQDESFLGWYAIGFLVLSAGTCLSNEIGMDGPANWVHLVAGVSPRAWLWARLFACATVMTLWLALAAIALGLLHDFGLAWQTVIGLSIQVMFLNMAMGLAVSVTSASPTSKPGNMMRRQKNNNSFSAGMMMLLLSFISIAITAPGIILALVTSHSLIGIAAQAPITVGVVWLIMRITTRRLETNWVKLFFKVHQWAV